MKPKQIEANPAFTEPKRRGIHPIIFKWETFAILFVIAIGSIIRFYQLGVLPIWIDEGFSEWASRQSIWYLWTILPTFETNPPFYYTLLKGWRFIFGDSETALRSLSVLFSIATIPFIFTMGKMLGTRRSGWLIGFLASLMFALSPIQVRFAQEARAYSMLGLGVAIALTAMMWIMLNRKQVCALASEQFYPGKARIFQAYGMLALGMALIMWAHDTGAFAVIAIALPALYWWVIDAKCCPRAMTKFLIAGLVAFALFLPYLIPLFSHFGDVKSSFWIKFPTWWKFKTTIIALAGGDWRSEEKYTVLILCVVAACASLSLWQRKLRSVLFLLVSVGVLPIVLELMVSYFVMPVFLKRTLLYVNIPLYILVAYGLSTMRLRAVGFTLSLIILVILSNNLQRHFTFFEKEPWDKITTHLQQSLEKGQTVIMAQHNVYPSLKYYMEKQDASFRLVGVPSNWPEPAKSNPSIDAIPDKWKLEKTDASRAAKLALHSQKIGLIMRHADTLIMHEIKKTHPTFDTKNFGRIKVIIFSISENNQK